MSDLGALRKRLRVDSTQKPSAISKLADEDRAGAERAVLGWLLTRVCGEERIAEQTTPLTAEDFSGAEHRWLFELVEGLRSPALEAVYLVPTIPEFIALGGMDWLRELMLEAPADPWEALQVMRGSL